MFASNFLGNYENLFSFRAPLKSLKLREYAQQLHHLEQMCFDESCKGSWFSAFFALEEISGTYFII